MPFDGIDPWPPRDSNPVSDRIRAALAGWRPLETGALRKRLFRASIRLRPVRMLRALIAIGIRVCRCGGRALVLGADRCASVRSVENTKLARRLRFSRGPPSEA